MTALTFEASAETRFIYQLMKPVPVGKVTTYGEMTDAAGKAIDSTSTALRTALKMLQRDDGIVFGCIRGVGFKRLNDVEIVNAVGDEIAGVRRRVKRTVHKASIANYEALPQGVQLRHTALMSVASMIAEAAKESSLNRVEAASAGQKNKLPIADTLKAMGLG